MTQGGGAVAQGAFAGQVPGDLGEYSHLRCDAAWAVGVTEVGHQRDFIDLGQRVQASPGGAVALRRETQPVHAGIHLQKHPVRRMGFVGGQHVDLFVAVHRVPQVQARAQLQVAQFEHAFEQQNRTAPAQGTHLLGFVEVQQRKAIGSAQPIEGPLDAMTVGVGLDDGPDSGVRRGLTCPRQIVAKRARMDGGLDRTGHSADVRQ